MIWHPFTQEKTAELPIKITSGKGSYIFGEKGNKYLDLISSWWVNLHGHANEYIAESIYAQAKKLEHVIFAGFTHEPAIEFCDNLKQVLPGKYEKVFFSDNGSTAVEVALKMAYQYWVNIGKKRSLFLCFDGGYHGDTLGAMSVGRESGYHNAFAELFFDTLTIPFPETWNGDDNVEEKEREALCALDDLLEKFGNSIAAIVLEPLIQGASGMRICRKAFLEVVVEKCKQCGILVVFDEVMTGFGRTGTNFAFEQLNTIPDFLCLSKGITGGFLPLSITVTTGDVYDKFFRNEWRYAFAHGHSYTANPISCAAAIASLKLLLSTDCKNGRAEINSAHNDGIALLQKNSKISKPRVFGTISAFSIDNTNIGADKFKKLALNSGLLLRPIRNTVYLMPPYCTTYEQLIHAYQCIDSILKSN